MRRPEAQYKYSELRGYDSSRPALAPGPSRVTRRDWLREARDRIPDTMKWPNRKHRFVSFTNRTSQQSHHKYLRNFDIKSWDDNMRWVSLSGTGGVSEGDPLWKRRNRNRSPERSKLWHHYILRSWWWRSCWSIQTSDRASGEKVSLKFVTNLGETLIKECWRVYNCSIFVI